MESLPSSSASSWSPFSGRSAWVVVLALSPLAYLGAYYLATRLPSPDIRVTIDRQRAIETALEFARTRQIDARDWRVTMNTNRNQDLAMLFGKVRPPALEQVAAAAGVSVEFRSQEPNRWMRVLLTSTGRVIGFSSHAPRNPEPAPDDAAAANLAESFLRDFLGPSTRFDLGSPKMQFTDSKKQNRRFEWQTAVPGFAQAQASFRVELTGGQVTAERCVATVDAAYLERLFPARWLYRSVKTIAGVWMALLGIYAIVRYVRRTVQKEVSHRRSILVALVFVACGGYSFYLGASESLGNGAVYTPGQSAVLLGFSFLLFGLMCAFFGVAYGAGEGDVRAAYPGKLTSLDALLCGKLFSANAARSILAGGAFAGAMLLIQNLALLAVNSARPVGDSDLVEAATASFPLAEPLSDTALSSFCIVAFGLLLPIAFLRARVKRERIFYALLPLFPIWSAVIFASNGSSWRSFAITLLVSTAVAWVPFFFGDLLASFSAVIALDFVSTLIYQSATTSRWARISLPVVSVGAVFLLLEIYFAERGKIFEDWEVRPLYARHLAERLALQAEIGAARQAQLRLLPDVPPQIAGLSIAGSCVPARAVGGDFYDLYALDDHRVGIFVAEGGNRELASAMPIALAKGYLLYSARLDLNPVEVLRRLRDVLEGTLHDGGTRISMLYAVIDARAACIRYARVGASPRVAINGNGVMEEVADSGKEMAIHQGAATLSPQDTLVFYTDGLAAQIAQRKREPVGRFLAKIAAKMREGTASDLHTAILQAAVRRMTEPPVDDVTAVVIRMEAPVERALEVVV